MPNTYFISDTHFGHANMLNFVQSDGVTPCRPFSSVEEMDETMISNWNAIVKPQDSVWHLGDVVINRKSLTVIQRLVGRKRLVMGNHDIFANKDYYNAGFEDLHAFKKFDDFVCTHIPVHPDNLTTRWARNVHGHTHNNNMRKVVGAYTDGTLIHSNEPDPRYINVCVEQINYTPISIEDLRAKFH